MEAGADQGQGGIVLHCVTLCYIVLHSIMPHHATLCLIVLHCIVLPNILLHCDCYSLAGTNTASLYLLVYRRCTKNDVVVVSLSPRASVHWLPPRRQHHAAEDPPD